MRQWPFAGDSPVARARKMALAYRSVAAEQSAAVAQLRDLLTEIHPKLLKWADNELAGRIHKALAGIHDTPVAVLDDRFYSWGEEWHTPLPETYELDDWVPAKVAGKLIGISGGSLSRLRRTGRIEATFIGGKGTGDRGRFLYQVRDVYALSSELRGREGRATDTVPEQEEVRSDDKKSG